MSWSEACAIGARFESYLQSTWPQYVEEMKGIAEGAGVDFASILTLNVRTEIAYGMAKDVDGCTAFAWKTKDASFLAQNWDWRYEQRDNIIKIRIEQPGFPTIHMMSEGGIIGKIGLNSSSVGVTLNAISALGVDYNKLPVHLALRTVLQSSSRKEAVEKLKRAGVAAACHITIADADTGAVGLECSSNDIVEMVQDDRGICTHSNHFVEPHHNAKNAKNTLPDSPVRLDRIRLLLQKVQQPTMALLRETLKDKQDYPYAICRGTSDKSKSETLFSIVMDLENEYAAVKMGQPTDGGEEFELRP